MYSFTLNDISITIHESGGLFSPGSLDRGTKAMLKLCHAEQGMKILDLGCGAGPVGIYLAHITGEQNITMLDVDDIAVRTARENAARNGFNITCIQSDGFQNLNDSAFDLILSNPPYQSDFRIAKGFIEKGFNRLKIGGRMYMVTKRRPWYENKFKAVFGGCRVIQEDGYFVFEAEKRQHSYANREKKDAKR